MTTTSAADVGRTDLAEAFLAAYPGAWVSALDVYGFFVAMPAGVPLLDHRLFEDVVSGLDLVVPADVDGVVRAWGRLAAEGVALAPVRLLADPTRDVEMHFFDMTDRHGIRLLVLTGADDLHLVRPTEGAFRPRVFDVHADQMGTVLWASPETELVLGWTPEDLVGRTEIEHSHPDDLPLVVSNWMTLLGRPGARRRSVGRVRHKDGHYVWLETVFHNLLHDPEHCYMRMEQVDISEQMAAQEALRASEQLLRTLAEALPLGVAQVDLDRSIVYRNASLPAILGQPDATDIDVQLADVLAPDRPLVAAALDGVLLRAEPASLEVGLFRHGQQRQVELKLRPLTNDDGEVVGAVVCVVDVTDPARMREELWRQATYDALTGCHNRASVLTVLDQALSGAAGGSGTALIFLDLDQFKQVNDVHGHGVGDDVLKAVATHLLGLARVGDVVGRVGGDEFVIVCRDVPDGEVAERIRERVVASMPVPVVADGDVLTTTGSVGVSWVATGSTDAERLIADADAAMYAAKRLRSAG
jgi:diguanylate cyclase (GGDEF)-like protein/PAS domain S-box-containing protein